MATMYSPDCLRPNERAYLETFESTHRRARAAGMTGVELNLIVERHANAAARAACMMDDQSRRARG